MPDRGREKERERQRDGFTCLVNLRDDLAELACLERERERERGGGELADPPMERVIAEFK